jgi:predicted PurR-regulated permease PerM
VRAKAVLILILLIACTIGTVSAQTVSFATIDATVQDVYMFRSNGTLIALHNTTSTGIELPTDSDVIFTIKPHTANPLDDPSNFLQTAFDYVKTNITALIIIMFLIGLFLMGRKR